MLGWAELLMVMCRGKSSQQLCAVADPVGGLGLSQVPTKNVPHTAPTQQRVCDLAATAVCLTARSRLNFLT